MFLSPRTWKYVDSTKLKVTASVLEKRLKVKVVLTIEKQLKNRTDNSVKLKVISFGKKYSHS